MPVETVPKLLLENAVVFITGGASGIGRECAIAYVREGASVAIADIDRRRAEETAHTLGPGSVAFDCNVASGASVIQAVRSARSHFGRLTAVHNNAGLSSPSKRLDETDEQEWDALMTVNLKSVYWTTHAALPFLREARGSILNTASMVGLIGQSNHAAYTATKGAMITLTKSMALDYARYGIRVNAICPAGVWTPMLEQWCAEQADPGAIRAYLDQIHALGYCPKGDVVAEAAAFLLSDRARFLTGCILPVSGGAELGYRR